MSEPRRNGNEMLRDRAYQEGSMRHQSERIAAQQTQDDNQARELHAKLAKGDEISPEDHEFLSNYHSSRGPEIPEDPYKALEE